MILDLLQLTAERFNNSDDRMDAFEVAQYIHLSDDIELHMAMGSDFDQALSLALETTEVI